VDGAGPVGEGSRRRAATTVTSASLGDQRLVAGLIGQAVYVNDVFATAQGVAV